MSKIAFGFKKTGVFILRHRILFAVIIILLIFALIIGLRFIKPLLQGEKQDESVYVVNNPLYNLSENDIEQQVEQDYLKSWSNEIDYFLGNDESTTFKVFKNVDENYWGLYKFWHISPYFMNKWENYGPMEAYSQSKNTPGNITVKSYIFNKYTPKNDSKIETFFNNILSNTPTANVNDPNIVHKIGSQLVSGYSGNDPSTKIQKFVAYTLNPYVEKDPDGTKSGVNQFTADEGYSKSGYSFFSHYFSTPVIFSFKDGLIRVFKLGDVDDITQYLIPYSILQLFPNTFEKTETPHTP